MGVSLFLLGSTRSKPPIAYACGGGVIELSPSQAHLNPLGHKHQICETKGHITHHILIVEHWQCVYYHGYHFSLHHGGCYLGRKIPPSLGILFKRLMLLLTHVLQLGSIRSHIGVVFILSDESSHQVFPRIDPGSFQVSIPGDRCLGQAFLGEVHLQFLIS